MGVFSKLADKGLSGCSRVVGADRQKRGCFGIPAAGALGLERRQDRSEFLHPAVVQSKQAMANCTSIGAKDQDVVLSQWAIRRTVVKPEAGEPLHVFEVQFGVVVQVGFAVVEPPVLDYLTGCLLWPYRHTGTISVGLAQII